MRETPPPFQKKYSSRDFPSPLGVSQHSCINDKTEISTKEPAVRFACRKEELMELEAMNTTSTYIGDTLFIVESVTADGARETATDKVKRLILNNLDEALKKAS